VTHVDSRYNQMDMQEDVQEDSGWKLVHGDVFRPPKRPLLLSVLLGSGSQLFMMVGATTSNSPPFVYND
jgi:transmembrane 9 superfamily member 2/4